MIDYPLKRYFLYHVQYNRAFSRRFARYICYFLAYLLGITMFVYALHTLEIEGFTSRPTRNKNLFRFWKYKKEEICKTGSGESSFTIYDNEFSHLTKVVVNPKQFYGKNKGGEELAHVKNQNEALEYYDIKNGAFQIECNIKDKDNDGVYKFRDHDGEFNYVNHYYSNTKLIKAPDLNQIDAQPFSVNDNRILTIAVTRFEYTNLYHSMTEWYNAYLLMRYFKHTPQSTHILFIDAHPTGRLDKTWKKLFNLVSRISQFHQITLFQEMAWSITGYNSPISHTSGFTHVPFLEDFRKFFLKQHKAVTKKDYKLNCEKVNIIITWRHQYIAHPRNMNGTLYRKVTNEKEIITHLKRTYPRFRIAGIQMDQMPITEQIELISETDILIGMHGAGLTHTLFLPKPSALIELFPAMSLLSNTHFKKLAEWRGVFYENWRNTELIREDTRTGSTYIPVNVVTELIEKVLTKLQCFHHWKSY